MLEHVQGADSEIDFDSFVTEDDEPVDNVFSERQQKLLGDCLGASWHPGRPYVALSNVGLFYWAKEPVVPDFLLSLDVKLPADLWEKKNRSYFLAVYAKPPDMIVEIVSNREGGEDTRKLELYRMLHVSYYAIFDPGGHLGSRPLRLFELRGTSYVELLDPFQPLNLGLSLTLWEGEYLDHQDVWLRWKDDKGELLATGAEQARRADQERERADQERERADHERERAEKERERAERLAARLRELGEETD